MYSGVPKIMPVRVSFARGPVGAGVLEIELEVGHLGDAEVDDLHEVAEAVALDQEDVLGLEIAVHDALLVRGRERLAALVHDQRRAFGDSAPPRASTSARSSPCSISITK